MKDKVLIDQINGPLQLTQNVKLNQNAEKKYVSHLSKTETSDWPKIIGKHLSESWIQKEGKIEITERMLLGGTA